MNDHVALSAGQKAIVDAYLDKYEPSDYFDPDIHTLVDTQTMIMEMGTMCELEFNPLSDYLVEKGYHAHYAGDDGISGWILHEIK